MLQYYCPDSDKDNENTFSFKFLRFKYFSHFCLQDL